MGRKSGYSNEHTDPYPLMALLALMLVADIIYSGPDPLIVATSAIIALLPMLPRVGLSAWFPAYLSMALSLFYASVSLPAMALLPAYTIALMHYVTALPHNSVPSGVIGPSANSVLRALPLFLMASLANYRVTFSIGVTASSILLLVVTRYVSLSSARVSGVDYEREVRMGSYLSIRVKIELPGDGFVLLNVGGTARIFAATKQSTLEVRIRPSSVGRHSLTLRVAVLDPWLVAVRQIYNYQITFVVLPAYSALVKMMGEPIAPLPAEATEPVKAEVLVLGGKEGPIERGGPASLEGLPPVIKRVISSLILRGRPTEERGLIGSGRYRGFVGEYYGVREFTPGDSLKFIHWKKSVSIGRLVVKEYASSKASRGSVAKSGMYAPIIVADLTPSGTKELDELITSFLDVLHAVIVSSEGARLLTIIVFGNIFTIVEGEARAVASEIASAFSRVFPLAIYEYVSIGTKPDDVLADTVLSLRRCCGFADAVAAHATTYARGVVEAILSHGLVPPKNVIIVGGRPTVVRNSFLGKYLKEAGFFPIYYGSRRISGSRGGQRVLDVHES